MISVVPGSLPPRRISWTLQDDWNAAEGWRGAQGVASALRNPQTPEALDYTYRLKYGITRTKLNERFLRAVPRYASILEVGAASGIQLATLAAQGYRELMGCDWNVNVCGLGAYRLLAADGRALPFRDHSFDLVFTSGTLMHIAPEQRHLFCRELLRVARRWVWGFELWGEDWQYWTFDGLIPGGWSGPEPASFQAVEPGLRLRDQGWVQHSHAIYSMYLLERIP